MDDELREWVERRFRVPVARVSKVSTEAEAVEKFVRPGDTVHLGITHARGSSAFWALLRRFRGTDPGFTLLAVAASSPFSPLVHAGLARRFVSSWFGDSYWTPGPNGVYQRAWSSGEVEFEHWSILTFSQRLWAAARGYGYAVTRSLAGSDMERNPGVRALGDGDLLVPALVPDVSIFHAPAADERGNVLFSPPLMENVYGALAARRGCIVTVDRIVDEAEVRARAHMTLLPSHAVAAVVEAPLGAHPGGLLPSGLDDLVDGYGEDYESWIDIRRAAKDPAAMDAWIQEWVLDTGTHERYVAKLGDARVKELRRRTDAQSWRDDLEDATKTLDLDAPPNAIETAIVAAARELKTRIGANGYTTMLAGAGMANLAAWLAAYDLADEGTLVDIVAEMGLVGYWPRPGEPILFNQRNFPTCTMLTDIDHTLSVVVGGARARSIGALGAAQVDKHGNINSTEVPGEYLLMGSGGANDVVTCATESVVIVAQNKERFRDRVDYVTGPGDRVRALVSTLGVFRKDESGEFVLTGVYGDDVAAAARECAERCGWDLRVARALEIVPGPTGAELRTLRLFDPRAFFRS
jgi:acyl CoA:acetate/3-ketoacid CoA transferase alpha subunit/acyl CoA:acetate/3-ketoacid CoA transferase beta subunit